MDDLGVWFAVSFVIGSIGFVLAAYGKSQRRLPQSFAGVVLLVFPFLVQDYITSVLAMFGITAAVCALCWIAVKRGH